jgi:hypothetical protein
MIKNLVMTALLGLAAWAVLALLVVVGLGVMSEIGLITEDMGLFNCLFMGNLTCGPDAPWHGFINLF